MFVDTYQEHCDHVAGCMSDHQNAYALSQSQFRSGMRGVMDLVRAGLHVVVIDTPAYCRFTDAALGAYYSVYGCYRDRADAERAAGELFESWNQGAWGGDNECGIDIYPLPPKPAVRASDISDDDDDIPF